VVSNVASALVRTSFRDRARTFKHGSAPSKMKVEIAPSEAVASPRHMECFEAEMPYGLFRWAIAPRLCGTKLCFVRTGAGPICHPVSRWMLKRVAGLAHYRSFRDEVSRDFLTGLGIDAKNDPVYPDLVFQLPTPPKIPAAESSDRPITIGVGVIDYCGWKYVTPEERESSPIYRTYISKMTNFILSLLERGCIVRLLIGEAADERAVNDLGQNLAEKGYRLTTSAPSSAKQSQLIAEPIQSLQDVMGQIAQIDVVVASRYHNVICALKLARPTISIGYEAKNDAIMAMMGLGVFCQHIEQLDLGQLNDQLNEMINNRSFYEQQTMRELEKLRGSMADREELLSLGLIAGV
jgi:polysaccharide pyruvyl transferase WcaK-like protein